MKIFLLAILAWFIFQFIFRLVIPVYRASRQFRKGFQAMQERMNEQQQQQQAAWAAHEEKPQTGAKPRASDYIDFEEVKG